MFDWIPPGPMCRCNAEPNIPYEPPAIVDESPAPDIPALVNQCANNLHRSAVASRRYLQLLKRIQAHREDRREQ
jgi:hypothetical protein